LLCSVEDVRRRPVPVTESTAGGGMTQGFAGNRAFAGNCLPPPSAGLARDL